MELIQSIQRAAAILQALATGGREGRRLIDIADDVGLRKSTAHRILNTLMQADLVEQDDASGRFHLGLGLFALGVAAADRYSLVELANDSLLRLADRTADTIYLSVRSNTEALCVDRVTGSFPIKTLTLQVGDRRPLGVGAGSLALLAWLPDQEIRQIIEANRTQLVNYGNFDAATLLELVEASRQQGYAFNDRMLIPGMSAVGVPVRGKGDRPIAALSVAAIEGRMQPGRRADIVAWLAQEAEVLQDRLGSATGSVTEASIRLLVGDHT